MHNIHAILAGMVHVACACVTLRACACVELRACVRAVSCEYPHEARETAFDIGVAKPPCSDTVTPQCLYTYLISIFFFFYLYLTLVKTLFEIFEI